MPGIFRDLWTSKQRAKSVNVFTLWDLSLSLQLACSLVTMHTMFGAYVNLASSLRPLKQPLASQCLRILQWIGTALLKTSFINFQP